MATTFEVLVSQVVKVTLDEERFTPEFMEEFSDTFYQFRDLSDHAAHLAQLEARGLISSQFDFVEGYGALEEMGVRTVIISGDEEILSETKEEVA